jgi:hypothetical protein
MARIWWWTTWASWLSDQRPHCLGRNIQMLEALQPTQDGDWVLSHEGYNVPTRT